MERKAVEMKQSNYINRELSWLEFNQRVLEQSTNPIVPILERMKFVAITASNLDEFFMVRVGSLQNSVKTGRTKPGIAGISPASQMELIRTRVQQMNADQADCLLNQIEPEMEKSGIKRRKVEELSTPQREHLGQLFEKEIVTAIAPIAVSGAHDFPFLRGARLCVCVRLAAGNSLVPNLGEQAEGSNDSEGDCFALIPMSNAIPRMIALPTDSGYEYILVEDVVSMYFDQLFPNRTVLDFAPFRVTRSADISLDEDGDRDLLAETQVMLDRRLAGDCVRLEIDKSAGPEIRDFLLSANNAEMDALYEIEGPLDLSAFFAIASLPKFQHLKDEPWPQHPSPDFDIEDDMFEVISNGDRLLCHPYQSYDPVVQFVQTAADDPNVIAIKQTLYRTARDSKIVSALADAAENGKHVTAIVELKARFDEARNIQWAQRLERAGVDVIYGVRGLKTHAKVCVVVRREAGGIKRYMHFGTGNYNESTAGLYSDISLFTCDPQLGIDIIHAFNAVTGLSVPLPMGKLCLAPVNLRESLVEAIRIETENAKKGIPAFIRAKCNSLVDKDVIDAMYEASQAGVNVELNIRGICCMRPGVPGVSENIRVISVVDRFLEHARVYHFHRGGDDLIMMASADIMPRNLDRRVELMVPLSDGECKNRLIKIVKTYFEDNVSAWELNSDATFTRLTPGDNPPVRAQMELYNESDECYAAQNDPKTTVFQAHRGGAS